MDKSKIILAAIAAALFASIIGMIGVQVHTQEKTREVAALGQDNLVWSFHQLNNEYLRLRRQITLAAHATEEHDAARQRYEIFASRLNVVDSGVYRRLFSGKPFYENALTATRDFIIAADTMLDGGMELTPGMISSLDRRLETLSPIYQEMLISLNSWNADYSIHRWQELRNLQDVTLAAILLQTLLAAAFAAIATWQILALRRSHRRMAQMTESLELARQEADSANQAKSIFLANISHEIRTPMNGVIGLLGLLHDSRLEAAQREYVNVALRSAENLLALVNDVLDYSKLEFRRLEIEEEDFKPAELMDDVIMLLAPRASEVGNVINRHIASDLAPWLRGDPMRIRQILVNLLGNAIKFTHDGVIDIHLYSHPDPKGGVILKGEVSDTGVGIAPENLDRLFQRFSQVDASPTRRFTGAGLGLAICRELCELMGGDISVRSAPGAGSTFTFRVRCAVNAAPHATEEKEPTPPLHIIKTMMRVLVVDDVATNRMLLGALLRKEGHAPFFANDGREAVRAMSRDPFDLVLMDVQMPVMDGVSATQAIRALDNAAAATPIVAVTANRDADDRDRYLAAGMNGYLGKPVRRGALLETLARFAPQSAATAPFAPSEPTASTAFQPNDHGTFAPQTPGEVEDLLDREQVESLISVLGLADWRACIDTFADSSRKQIAAIVQSLNDQQSISAPAHTLKGMSVNVGARQLADVARRLEKAPPDEAVSLSDLLPNLLRLSVEALRAAGDNADDADDPV